MQRIALIFLGAAVVFEGAYMISLQHRLTRLTAQLEPAAAPAAVAATPGRPVPAAPARPGGRELPVFASVSPASAATLDVLGSPPGRQKLQEILASFKEERRREKLLSSLDRRLQSGQRLRASLGELGLPPDETRRTEEVLDRLAGQRRQLLDELQGGAKGRADVKRELDAAGRGADAALQDILGEKRMSALRELRKRVDRAPEPPAPAP